MNKKIIFIISLFVIYFVFRIYGSPFKKIEVATKCHEYLSETYSEKIKIKRIDYSFKTKTYSADVISTTSNVLFKVILNNNGEITDSYFIEYWKKETSENITHKVEEVYGENSGTGSLYFTQGSPIDNDEYKIKKSIPDFSSVRDKFNTAIFGFISISLEFNESKAFSEYDKIYQICEYVFNTYSPKNISVEYLNNVKFRIGVDEFSALEDKSNIQKFRQ